MNHLKNGVSQCIHIYRVSGQIWETLRGLLLWAGAAYRAGQHTAGASSSYIFRIGAEVTNRSTQSKVMSLWKCKIWGFQVFCRDFQNVTSRPLNKKSHCDFQTSFTVRGKVWLPFFSHVNPCWKVWLPRQFSVLAHQSKVWLPSHFGPLVNWYKLWLPTFFT